MIYPPKDRYLLFHVYAIVPIWFSFINKSHTAFWPWVDTQQWAQNSIEIVPALLLAI